ncbi:MAG: hypothetical protein JRJ60_17560 [Deltaproteobacteria bacterium]|nr:hypothetical protein [Deltaproteobacteria bacterium]
MRRGTRVFFLAFSWMLMFSPGIAAQTVQPESILIRNVRLIDRDGKAEDKTVNILIKDKKLEVVSRDKIPTAGVGLTVDAQNGILLGNLDMGSPPSFLILDQDPRDNFEVLLDTATHARFAVHKGEIVKNTLPDAGIEAADEEPPKKSGWLAYTPPPMALPLSYQDDTKWNKWETKYVSGIFLAALILDRQFWLSQDEGSELQVGDLRDYDGGEIRGLRLGAVGTLNFKTPWVYTVFAATNAFDRGFDTEEVDSLTLFDYRLDIPLSKWAFLSVGKQKEPISMERIMSLVYLPMQERSSVSDAMLPARNVGVVLNGTGFNRRMTWAGGAFNDWFDAGQSFDDATSQFVGRVTWLPFLSGDESNLFHLGFGMRYSDAKEGGRFLTEPEFTQAPIFVDTGLLEADSTMTYNLEASWRKGPFWVGGEYLSSQLKSPSLGDPRFSGYHLTGSWIITGEMRAYNRRSGVLGPVPVSRSVYQGGVGAWEAAIRWSDLDLSDGEVDGGKMGILSLGWGEDGDPFPRPELVAHAVLRRKRQLPAHLPGSVRHQRPIRRPPESRGVALGVMALVASWGAGRWTSYEKDL